MKQILLTFLIICTVACSATAASTTTDTSTTCKTTIYTLQSSNNPADTVVVQKMKPKNKNKKNKSQDLISLDGGFWSSLAIDILTVTLTLLLIYVPRNKKRDFIFSFFMFNIVIYLLTYVLNEIKISLGAAFGLFAVFSMLRYRTTTISMKDMSYLFIFIAIGLLSAIHLKINELAIINGIIFICIFILDSRFFAKRELSQKVVYNNLDLISPAHSSELLSDLSAKTGLTIHRYTISEIDLAAGNAIITAYYFAT